MKKNKLQKEIKPKLKTTFLKKNSLALPKTSSQKDNFLEALKENILPTPTVENQLSSADKQKIIETHFTEILKTLGLDLRDDSLQDSPKRIAKMYVQEIFNGLDWNNFPKITTIENKMNYNQMIAVQNIEVISCCEHHFQTIQGFATVAYIPQKKVIGLSKINRIVQFFSRRPQVQERLTKQIADCLQYILETPHVAVHINAKHFCVIARGIQDANSSTITTDLRGDFKNRLETRKEFLHSCK